jgi:hypothetical protein
VYIGLIGVLNDGCKLRKEITLGIRVSAGPANRGQGWPRLGYSYENSNRYLYQASNR